MKCLCSQKKRCFERFSLKIHVFLIIDRNHTWSIKKWITQRTFELQAINAIFLISPSGLSGRDKRFKCWTDAKITALRCDALNHFPCLG